MRYEVRYEGPATNRWLVIREGRTISSAAARTQSEAIEFGRNRLRKEGGTLAIFDVQGALESEQTVDTEERDI